MNDKEQATVTPQEILAANQAHSRELNYPIAISEMAEDMGYTSEEAVTTEIAVGELFNRRYFARKRQEWMIQAMKNTAPKKFYVWLRIPHMKININTFSYGVARGEWKSVSKALAFCKAKLAEANPEWRKQYTFQYSFVPANNGVMVMIPSIRRKMDEKSRFMEEGGNIKLARHTNIVEEELHTMTHQEVEQKIISGEFDNVDPFIEDAIGEYQNKYKNAQMNAKTWKHVATQTGEAKAWNEYKNANKEYKEAYRKLSVARSRRNAYNDFSTTRCDDDLDLRESSNAYAMTPRDIRLLNELELAYLNLFRDRQDMQDCILNKEDPQVLVTEAVEEMIFESDIDDKDLALISIDILGEPILPTLEDMHEDKTLKFTRAQYDEHEEMLEGGKINPITKEAETGIRVDAAISNILMELAPKENEKAN